jgi:ubiquinone biosynthesis protein
MGLGMTQLNQTTGHNLLVAGNGLDKRRATDASLSLNNWRHGTQMARSRRQAPGFLVKPRDLTYQTLLRTTAVKVNRMWVLLRLFRLLFYAAIFWSRVLWHRVSERDTEKRQRINAEQFRELLIKLSGVMIKVGQQLSQRPDLLPPAYCDELRVLLEDLPTKIDKADVIAAIERQMGKPMRETFAEFNFDPVGSASVACVYRAVLHTGEEVAVKVRRPHIQKEFTADIDALNWLLYSFEFLTVWRPGLFKNFRLELKDLLLEELDFRREARYQELFRRYHKRRKKLNVTAPKVHYKLSGEEVLVTEFVRGYKVQKIIEAMETGDEAYLADLRNSGIKPKVVAKHLARSRYYSFHECPLFHGDPHPSNILVQANNRIVMLDFGACGVFSHRDRNLMWQMNYYYSRDDVAGMVNMVLRIMEPIEVPVKIEPFRKELLDAWWTGFYGIKSNHAQWWERTSIRLWLRFFELIRKHQIPIPRNMVRMIRATLLYDTVAARLYGKINVFHEFEKYSQDVARRARRQIVECAIRQLLFGPDDAAFLKFKQIAEAGDGLLSRVQKFLNDPEFRFAQVAGKIYSAIRAFVRLFMLSAAAGLIAAVVGAVLYVTNIMQPGDIQGSLSKRLVLLTPVRAWHLLPPYSYGALQIIVLVWFIIVAGLILIYGRRIYLRFGDVDD